MAIVKKGLVAVAAVAGLLAGQFAVADNNALTQPQAPAILKCEVMKDGKTTEVMVSSVDECKQQGGTIKE